MLAATIHNGCAVEMDRSGWLWVSMGDANQSGLAQDRSSLNGKILRTTRDGGTPADNPVIDGTRNVVYSMGHRNPQGIAIRPGTDQVYAVEHGPAVNDEVNRIVPGGNYGWPCHTGAVTAACGPSATTVGSLWASGASTIATSGATFVAGSQWADYDGQLFVTTLKERDVRRFGINAPGTSLSVPATHFDGVWGRLRASVLGPGGQLYLTTSNGAATGSCPTGDCVIRIRPATPSVNRLAGVDRYATAAALSASGYPAGATDVMVATGAGFPDALAASAAAGRVGMPVLLTRPTQLPTATTVELERLRPQRIWVLGGTGVISESVRTALGQYASSGQVARVSGADRYETAARISMRWSSPGVPAAFVAVGTDFADALSAAPAAALRDSPLLLVSSTAVPGPTAAELDRLDPQRIYVLGGSAAISDAVVTSLAAYTSGPVTRLAGANRYATSGAVVRAFWTKSAHAYVANGVQFPDALTGGAVAGRDGVPMLLSREGSVPLHTGQEALRLSPQRLTMLGGTAALDVPVEAGLKRLLATP